MMAVFWNKGYEATSMRDLEKASQLTAGSIYHEFGSKKQLFYRTLSFYINTVIETRIQKYLLDSDNPIHGIKEFLITTFKGVPEPFQKQSCLLVNTAAELGQEDGDIGKVINQGFHKIETAMVAALKKARSQGQIAQDLDIESAAKSFSLLMPGLLIAAKNNAKPKTLQTVVEFQINQLIS